MGCSRSKLQPVLELPAARGGDTGAAQHHDARNMLLRAAKDGNTTEIKRLLRAGGAPASAPASAPAPAVSLVNSRGMWDTPALVFACQYGRAAAALELLRHGADARLANARGGTALLYACVESTAADMAEVAVALIAAGAGVEAPPVRVYDSLIDRATQHTPLTAAASRLPAEAVVELAGAGAGVGAGVGAGAVAGAEASSSSGGGGSSSGAGTGSSGSGGGAGAGGEAASEIAPGCARTVAMAAPALALVRALLAAGADPAPLRALGWPERLITRVQVHAPAS